MLRRLQTTHASLHLLSERPGHSPRLVLSSSRLRGIVQGLLFSAVHEEVRRSAQHRRGDHQGGAWEATRHQQVFGVSEGEVAFLIGLTDAADFSWGVKL